MKDILFKYKWPLLVAALAVVVRWIYLFELSLEPGFTVPMVDERWHWEWAHDIIENSFWGEGAWFRAPLYPYFLAVLVWITDSTMFWVKFLQVLLCGGTAFFIYRLGENLFHSRVGLLAGIIYAFYGTMLYYETMLLIPSLFLFFIVWGMFRLVAYKHSVSIKTWLLTGIIFGLAAISRPNILLVIPLLMLWMILALARGREIIARIKRPLVLGLGLALAVAPVTIRNAIVTGEFILISSQGGVNLYLGNNPVANGLTMLMPEVDLTENLGWSKFMPATKAAAQREAGRQMSEAELSSFWTGKAIDFVIEHPDQFLELVFKKSVYLISGYENSDNHDIYYERNKSILYSLLLWDFGLKFPYGLLFPFTLAGIILYRREWRKLLPVYVFLIGYIPTIVLFLVTARHRLPFVPFMIIIAAAGILKLIYLIKTRRLNRARTPLVIMLVVALIFNFRYFDLKGVGSNEFQIHFNAGIKYEHLGDYKRAEQEYLKADQVYPFSPSLMTNLGHAQYQQGKLREAAHNYARALDRDPRYHRAYNNLGLLIESNRNFDSAVVLYNKAVRYFNAQEAREHELGRIYVNLANAYEQVGKIDSAAYAYRKAMESAPLLGPAYSKAAAFFARHERYELTDSLFVEGMRRHELSAGDFFNWGLSYIERQRYSDGIGMMFRALKRDTSLYQAYYVIAVGLFEGGYPVDTVNSYLDRCLNINPAYEPAQQLQEMLEK